MAAAELCVFYREEVNAVFDSDSPSPRKPGLVVRDWLDRGLAVRVVSPEPVTREDFYLAHRKQFVNAVLGLRRDNGFFNREECVARSLPYTTGAMVAAAFHAVTHRTSACAPVSGFHHATYDEVGAFCTFNGLVVAAQKLARAGLARRVGILDYDMHDGDGTRDIVRTLRLGHVEHYSAATEYKSPTQAAEFLRRVPEHVGRMGDCQVILYQAGADPHVRDPLGGWLTTAQLRERDRLVFATARELGVPVAWNLAGGYQEEPDGSIPAVLEVHRNTALECLAHL